MAAMLAKFRNLTKPQMVVAGVIVAAGFAATGLGVYASVTATANNSTAQPLDSGTLRLSMAANGVGLATPIAAMAPGDVVNRHIVLDNFGTLTGQGLTLQVGSTISSALTTDAVKGLQATVTTCSVAWTAGTGLCSGTAGTPVISPLSNLINAGVPILTGTVPTHTYLQVKVALPDSSEDTLNGVIPGSSVQGLTASLMWNFTETQRAATTTSS